MASDTIFQRLGLTVLAAEGGVYHFRRQTASADESEVVGLLYVEGPLTKQSETVKLFLQEVVPDVPAARIMYHWQTLDARRFEESGLEPLVFDLGKDQIPARVVEQRFTRPDGVRIRHAAQLTTGEVVCYN